MRKAITIVAFMVTACLLSGCDFFRVLAGRPTSREIEEKRKAILLLDAAEPQADTVQLAEEPVVEQPAASETSRAESAPARQSDKA